jgi:endonuclease/exonuclease/phosphatase family metal-dependent hydrolase
VMTRNIYLVGNIALPIGAGSRAEFEQRTTQLWQQVQATDFPARAKLLAREVRRTKPDVIGLQEVALWRRGPDGAADAEATQATTTVYDFLATLRGELGARYRLGNVQTEAGIEAPTSLGYDVRKRGTVILTGDLNSDPTGATGAKPDAYNVFTRAGLRDTWLLRNPKGSGNNCCLKQETITDPPPGPFDHRVDHILARGRFKVLRTRIVGTDPANRTAAGLWPSDHGGGATTLRLR